MVAVQVLPDTERSNGLRFVQQMAGLHYAATPGALLSAMQLYSVLQSEGLLPEDCAGKICRSCGICKEMRSLLADPT